MNSMKNIHMVARYEARLLRRSWLFRIFAGLAVVGIFLAVGNWCTPLFGGGMTRWNQVALSGQIPFFSMYLFHILQAVAVVFLAGGRMATGRKADTMDVLYARQAGNGDFVWGKVWGTLKVCGGLMAAVMAVVVFLHVAVAKSPFSLWAYFFYALTLALPSLVFVLGLSLWVNCVVKGRALALLLLLGGMGMLYSYLKEVGYGVLDVFGQTAPMVGSDVTGMADMGAYLLQRGMFLVAGIGLVFLTVAAFPRLPNRPGTAGMRLAGWGYLVLAIMMGCAYVWNFRAAEKRTAEYGAVYDRYADAGQVHVAEQALEVKLDGSRLQGKSRMTVVNAGAEEMERVVLYLNPGLRVEKLVEGEETVPFAREGQAVIVERALRAGDTLRLEMEYGGTIDEAVCYTDVPLKNRREQPKHQGVFCFGKRYAWVEKGFAQLTPECLWYPTGTAAAHPISPFDIRKDFTRYSLTVEHPEGMTVISQGEATRKAGVTRFANRTPLPGISLTAGDYERMDMEVDSVLYEVYYFRGHDFFSEPLAILRDTMENYIRETRMTMEYNWTKDYPFRKFALVETPAPYFTYLRNQKGYTEFTMPEIIFLSERGYRLSGADFASNMEMISPRLPEELQTPLALTEFTLNQLLEEIFGTWAYLNNEASATSLAPLFTQHTSYIYSEKYPALDLMLQQAQKAEETAILLSVDFIDHKQRANAYLKEHSLKDAVTGSQLDINALNAIIDLKGNELQQYICLHVPTETYRKFIQAFFQQHAFETVPLDTLCEAIRAIDSLDLRGLIEEWYNRKGTPAFIFRDVQSLQVAGLETEAYQIRFKAYNPSETDGLLNLRIMSSANAWNEHFLLPAHTAREYRIYSEGEPHAVNVKTNISQNIPSQYIYQFASVSGTVRDSATGVFPADPRDFLPPSNEIIIDNEDAGFQVAESKTRHKLKDFFQKQPEGEYQNTMFFSPPPHWIKTVMESAYGDVVQSAAYKRSGTGQATATWTAKIPENGYYEIAVWNPRNMGMEILVYEENGKQTSVVREQQYIVRYEGQEEEEAFTINLEEEDNGWISLGRFDLPAGEASVTLTDKGSWKFVIADAVKFTRIE